MLRFVIHLLFFCYAALLIVRVVGSWVPSMAGHPWMRFVISYTDPYLNLFRRYIPPLGGMLDLSPLVGLLALQFAERLLLMLLH